MQEHPRRVPLCCYAVSLVTFHMHAVLFADFHVPGSHDLALEKMAALEKTAWTSGKHKAHKRWRVSAKTSKNKECKQDS